MELHLGCLWPVLNTGGLHGYLTADGITDLSASLYVFCHYTHSLFLESRCHER